MLRVVRILLAIGAVISITALQAQTTVGELRGTVTDPTGAPIGEAGLTLQNVATNDLRRTASDAEGNYIYAQLPVGTYLLSVEKTGFQKFTVRDVVIQVDARRREDVTLRVGDVTQEVTG
jgi:hypothetical protein